MFRFPHRLVVAALAPLLAACVESAPAAAPAASSAAPAAPVPPAAAPADPTIARADSARDALLDSVRAATRRFADVSVAVAEGYVAEGGCVALPGVGAMGVHYVHPARAGITMRDGRVHGTDARLDPTQPEIVIYEPQQDGSLRLVAVEWYTSKEAWGDRPAPSLFGVPFDSMLDDPSTPGVDEGHGFTPHWDQHVWLYRDNPAGLFAQWNANVTCPAGAPATSHAGH